MSQGPPIHTGDRRRLDPAAVVTLVIAWAAVHLVSQPAAAEKTDVVVLKNGDHITGEIDHLEGGRLVYETDSVGTINIEWEDIAKLASPAFYRMELENGAVYYGSLATPQEAGKLQLVEADSTSALFTMGDVVRIQPIQQRFWKRFDGGVSIGFSFAQASKVTQLTAGFDATYTTRSSTTTLDIDSFVNDQEGVDPTSRFDSSLQYIRTLERWRRLGWFGRGEFQSNEELGLELRMLASAGLWRALYQDFRTFAVVGTGMAVSEEYATGSDAAATNTELLVLAGYNYSTYDYPKTKVSVRGDLYPSLSDWGRVRFEFDANLERELWHDFTLKLSPYESYDSDPPEVGAAKNDWGVTTSIGWDF